MGPARGATLCPLRSRFAPRRCSYNKTKPAPEPVGAPAPGANGCLPGRKYVPASFAVRTGGGAPTEKNQNLPRPRRSTRPGCEGGLLGALICACSGSHRGRCSYNKTKTYPDPVGAPAPGAKGCLPASYPVIGKPGPFHKLGVPDISTIQQQRLVHLRMQTLEVRAPIGLPLGHQHQRIGAGGGFIGIVMQNQIIPLPRPGSQCQIGRASC